MIPRYDKPPDYSDLPEGIDYKFVATCSIDFIQFHDNLHSSWQKVDFTLKNGVLRANVTDEGCPNPRAPTSGFIDLQFYLEGSGAVLGSSDGYSKLLNL